MNAFRQLLRAAGSKPPIGTWISSASPIVAEAIGHAGFDWGVVDMEHAPLDMMNVLLMLQALGNTRMVAVVRVPWNDAVMVKRVLDAGALITGKVGLGGVATAFEALKDPETQAKIIIDPRSDATAP